MGSADLSLVLKVLFLLALANGAPVIVKRVFGDHFNHPVDGGTVLRDGGPVFGSSKTIRGLACSLIITACCAPLVEASIGLGLLISSAAMAGDLFSSFLKRRMRIPCSAMALGLDQIPESLLPALAARGFLPLTFTDVAVIVGIFLLAELVLSRALFALQIRDQPY